MAIKINLESVKIPLEIGDLKFEIDVTDEKYEAFIKNFNIFLEKMEVLDEEKTEDLALIKEMVKEVYEDLLGKGAYEQIYEKMPNTAFVSKVLVTIVSQMMIEMESKSSFEAKSNMKVVTKKATKKK